MKKTILALLASACALGVSAKELAVDNTTYEYEEISADTVELTAITPPIEGSELDLGAVQKLFSSNNLQIVSIPNVDNLVSDREAVTSVVLPEYFENRDQTRDLCDMLPNLESFSGGGALLTLDGLVYADGGRFLIRCPRARAGAVRLPSNCREIMDAAFSFCTNLTGVTGGEEVLRVGYESFGSLYDMDGLPPFIANLPDGIVMVGRTVIGWKGDVVPDTIELPAGATSVAASAFPYDNVTNVVGGANVRWVGDDAFPGLVDAAPAGEFVVVGKVLLGCNGDVAELDVPEGVVTIAPKAFNGKLGLEHVTLPDTVKEVGEGAFAGCGNIVDFTFGQATETLGFAIFASCGNLQDVYFRGGQAPLADAGLYEDAPAGLVTHIKVDATGWPQDGQWCDRELVADLKRDPVTGQVGYYGKWTLAKLGVPVPPAGTVYSATAYGLPQGLVLKANAAKKKGKKIVTPAKTSWWIEGVPTATLDGTNQTAFVKTTVNGFSELHPLAFVVAETPVIDVDTNKYPLAVKKAVVMPGNLPELGAGWTLSGLPVGLKQTKKAVKVKLAGKSRAVQAYGVYGTPTVPGNYVATAKKKSGSWNLVRKLRFQVRDENGELTEDPQDDRTPVMLNFNGGDGTVRQDMQGGVRNQPQSQQLQIDGEPVIYSFAAPHGATLTLSGAPANTLSIVEDPDYPGTWLVVGSAPPGDYLLTVVASQEGSLDARQTLMIHFDALPAWSTGSFAGYVTDPENFSYPFGYCTVTVGAKGAISGKFAMNDSTYTFSTNSYTAGDNTSLTVSGIPLKVYEMRSVYDKKKRKDVNKQVLVDSDLSLDIEVFSGVAGLLTGKVKDKTGDTVAKIHAPQNLWSTSYKSIGTSLFRASAKQQYRTYKQTLEGGATLTFKITPLGKVTVTGSIPYKKKVKKNGRWVYVTAYTKKVASTVLMPETAPETGAAGFRGRVAVCLGDEFRNLLGSDVRFNGGFVDFPFPVNASSWSMGEFNGVAYVKLPNRFYDEGKANEEWDYMYGTYNIKVNSSLAFTGTFTPAVGATQTFSGKFEQQESAGAANVYFYEATSTLLWDGWMIPFKLTLVEGGGGTGNISFETTEPGAAFCSDNGLGLPASLIGQDLFLCSDMGIHIMQDPGIVWADMNDCQMGNDTLTYRFSGNGRVSISGMIDGSEVKTSAVIQFVPQDNLSIGPYTGCFSFCLGEYGLFRQQCTFGESVSVENLPLQCVWTPNNE